MKAFNDENFLLQTETAQRLYHEHAAKQPIIDYHCHLIPEYVASNHRFENLSKIWLEGDHYKWRAMRTNGVEERYCTGKDTTDWEKFEKWAATVPYTMRNPLYHWTHLELKTAFGVTKLLNPSTAREIYDHCTALLQQPEYYARGLMQHYNVEVVCTTDDPVDSLEHHIKVREDGFAVKMLPTWRPDKAMAVESAADFRAYIERLSEVSGVSISQFADVIDALRVRHRFFESVGCRLSDHGIEEFYAEDYTQSEIDAIFNKVYGGHELTADEIRKYKTAMMVEFAVMDHETGWTQQFHYGAIRNNNSRMFAQLGPDTGFDSIGDFTVGKAMSKFFDLLDREDGNKLYAEAHGATSEEIETAVAADGIDPDSYRVTINAHRGYNVYRTNNVCYIIAKEGDRYEHLASLFMVSPKNLRRFNDVAKDAQPKKGDIVFIERKRKRWEGNSLLHTVRQNETLYSLSCLIETVPKKQGRLRNRILRMMGAYAKAMDLEEDGTGGQI